MRPVQQGSERSQPQARQCVEVKAQAASVPHSAHMDSSTVKCVGKSLATSTTVQMPFMDTLFKEDQLTVTSLMV